MEDFHPKNILCPIDFSELSDLAFKYAAAGARVYGSKLTVLHAERFELPRYFSQNETRQFLQEMEQYKTRVKNELASHVENILSPESNSLDVEWEVLEDTPVEAILQSADKNAAGLIVLGTHGLGGVKRLLMGSVAENVVRAAKIPVFTVRQKEHDFIDVNEIGMLPQLKRILCPCEINELGRIVLNHAVSLAERFQAKLTVLYSDEFQQNLNLSQAKEALCDWISEAIRSSCDLEPIVRQGDAADQILILAEEQKDDLIVMGARHRIFRDATVLGKTTDLVVRHASLPVMTIPTFSKI